MSVNECPAPTTLTVDCSDAARATTSRSWRSEEMSTRCLGWQVWLPAQLLQLTCERLRGAARVGAFESFVRLVEHRQELGVSMLDDRRRGHVSVWVVNLRQAIVRFDDLVPGRIEVETEAAEQFGAALGVQGRAGTAQLPASLR